MITIQGRDMAVLKKASKEARWRQKFITQPPCVTVLIRERLCENDIVLRKDAGVRLGDVVDAWPAGKGLLRLPGCVEEIAPCVQDALEREEEEKTSQMEK